MRTITGPVLAVLLTLAASPATLAHVSLEQGTAAVGAIYRANFRVPHGCEGHATTIRITVQLPEGVTGARPMPKAGWSLGPCLAVKPAQLQPTAQRRQRSPR